MANTLAVKSVTVIVLDVKPVRADNCMCASPVHPSFRPNYPRPDNINFYQCDVSKWEEVDAVSKKIIEEVGLDCGMLTVLT